MLTQTLGIALLPLLGAAPASVVRYDLTPLFALNLEDPSSRRRMWDETQLVSALQGIVNRDEPRLWVRFLGETDDFWWAKLTAPDGWLADCRVEEAASLEDLLARFAAMYEGAVLWDERVPATSNLASSIAGAANLLPLRADPSPESLCQRLTAGERPLLTVRESLLAPDGGPLFTGQGTIAGTELPSSGSAKCDAYLWLVAHWLETGRLDPHTMGYYLDADWLRCWRASGPDNHTLTNHDFVIARRGLIFDLSPWDDEAPVDDPNQPLGADARTLCAILRAAWERLDDRGVIHVAGFVPWAYKYTNFGEAGGSHEGVPAEWRYAEILSCYNAYMDADALGLSAMANASFHQHFPLPERIEQNPKPTRESLQARGLLDAEGRIAPKRYYAHYVGDYDAAAWMYRMLPTIWTDPRRGEVPLSWAFNPNLAERFPLGMAWTRATRTANDFFIAGDSGAGYLNPGYLTPPRRWSELPSGLAAWEAHCQRSYDRWDLSATGFVIDGYAPPMAPETLSAYARFSPGGVVAQKVPPQSLVDGVPFLRMCMDLPHEPAEAGRSILGGLGGEVPTFQVFRSILKSPTWYAQVAEETERLAPGEAVCVDLYTLMWLLRAYLEDPAKHVPPSPWSGAETVRATPEESAGLRAVPWDDGRFRVEVVDGATAWVLPTREPPGYLYLATDRGFRLAPGEALVVSVEYRDTGAGEFALEYDSHDGAAPVAGAYKGAGRVARTGSGEWKVAEFRLPDARLGKSQNGGSDLRLYSRGEDLFVREVVVRRAP